jgi:hypothetical protein
MLKRCISAVQFRGRGTGSEEEFQVLASRSSGDPHYVSYGKTFPFASCAASTTPAD